MADFVCVQYTSGSPFSQRCHAFDVALEVGVCSVGCVKPPFDYPEIIYLEGQLHVPGAIEVAEKSPQFPPVILDRLLDPCG